MREYNTIREKMATSTHKALLRAEALNVRQQQRHDHAKLQQQLAYAIKWEHKLNNELKTETDPKKVEELEIQISIVSTRAHAICYELDEVRMDIRRITDEFAPRTLTEEYQYNP